MIKNKSIKSLASCNKLSELQVSISIQAALGNLEFITIARHTQHHKTYTHHKKAHRWQDENLLCTLSYREGYLGILTSHIYISNMTLLAFFTVQDSSDKPYEVSSTPEDTSATSTSEEESTEVKEIISAI